MAMRFPAAPLGPHAAQAGQAGQAGAGQDFPPPQDAPGARASESPVDHALTLLLAGETDAAMRWAAAVLEKAPSPGALLVTSRLLDQMGRTRAAVEGMRLTVQLSVDRGDLPLAVAAIDDLRVLGHDVDELLEVVSAAFCRGSARLRRGDGPPRYPSLPVQDFVQPLSPFLAGPALASKATQIVQDARRRYEDAAGSDLPRITPLPLFSSLPKDGLRDLLAEFHALTVPSGHRVMVEGEEGSEAYVVARGEVEISRRAAHGDNKFTLALARLSGGAFFGEMALLSLMPCPATATTTRPSILRSARRDALVDVAAARPEIAGQLASHCRRNSLANLGWTSQVVAAVPPAERATLVERLEMRLFEKGDLLVQSGEESPGLHLIVSGEVAIVAREWGERVLLATLGAGDTVGEMELVLCRQPFADAVAMGPAAALFLSRGEYASLIQDHPAILHGLYAIAVQRQAETTFALKSGSAVVADDWLLDATSPDAPFDGAAEPEEPTVVREERDPFPSAVPARVSVPPALPAVASPPPPPPPPLPSVLAPEEQPARHTLPPPPPAPPPTVAPASLSPTAASMRPSLVPLEPPRASWVSFAAVTASAAIAASVVTVMALRGTEGGSASTAAAHQPAAAVETLPPVAIPTLAATVTPTPTPTPTATPTPAAALPVAAPARRPTPVVPAAPATVAHVERTPAAPRPTVRADAPVAASPASGTEDEFGGRN